MILKLDLLTATANDLDLAIATLRFVTQQRFPAVASPAPQCASIVLLPEELSERANDLINKGVELLHRQQDLTPVEASVPSPPAEHPRLPEVPSPPVELDAADQPWDPALHSESKAKTVDGLWRKRRNTGRAEAKPEPAIPPPPALSTEPVAAVASADASPVPPPPPVTVTSFSDLMTQLARSFGSGALDTAAAMAVCSEHGISSLQECHLKPELIPAVWASLTARMKAPEVAA